MNKGDKTTRTKACRQQKNLNQKLNEERNREIVFGFFESYFACETLYKDLYYRYARSVENKAIARRNIRVDIARVRKVVSYFELDVVDSDIALIFKTTDRKPHSAKSLRDRTVHAFTANRVEEIVRRFERLNSAMNRFLMSCKPYQ